MGPVSFLLDLVWVHWNVDRERRGTEGWHSQCLEWKRRGERVETDYFLCASSADLSVRFSSLGS